MSHGLTNIAPHSGDLCSMAGGVSGPDKHGTRFRGLVSVQWLEVSHGLTNMAPHSVDLCPMAGGVSRPDKHCATFGGLEKSDLKYVICSFPFSIEKSVCQISQNTVCYICPKWNPIPFSTVLPLPQGAVPLYPSHKGQFHQNHCVATDVMTNFSRRK